MRTAVLGAGAWGTSLALLLARRGHPVRLWARDSELARRLAESRVNAAYLPGQFLPKSVEVVSSVAAAAEGVELLVIAVPAQHLRTALSPLRCGDPTAIWLSATKGIERSTLLRVSQVLSEIRGSGNVAALSGPSFASEVARGCPTAVTVAANEEGIARAVQDSLSSDCFRIYTSDDLVGVEIGGALKNVIAIAGGMVRGLDLGANALAALLTRGLAEMSRLGVALGARRDTFQGLSGIGDLLLTGTGTLSRNARVGEAVARGESLIAALGPGHAVAEGVETAVSADLLAHRLGVEMPITRQVVRVLHEGADVRDAVHELMRRRLRAE